MNDRGVIYTKNQKSWDDFLLSTKYYHIFQSFAYLKLKENFKFLDNWKTHLLIFKERENISASCGILQWKPLLFPFSFLWTPAGPNLIEYNEEILNALYKEIMRLGKKNPNIVFFTFSPYIEKKDFPEDKFLKSNFVKIDIKIPTVSATTPIMILDLNQNIDEIYNNFEKDTRYMIRKAEKNSFIFKKANSLEDLKIFHNMLKDSGKRKNFPVRGFSNLKNLWQKLNKDLIHLFLVEKNSEILSGAVLLTFGKKCWWLYGASIKNIEKNTFPNHFLQWEIIKWAKERGFLLYDMRGAMGYNHPPSSSGYGVYHFKKGFGAKLIHLAGDWGVIFKPKIYKISLNLFYKFLPFAKRFIKLIR